MAIYNPIWRSSLVDFLDDRFLYYSQFTAMKDTTTKSIRRQCEAQQSYCMYPKCDGCGFSSKGPPPMLTVYKYPVPSRDSFTLELPKGAEILHFDSQKDTMHLWAKVDTDAPLETRAFRLAETGHDLLDMMPHHELAYIGSAKLMKDSLVFHLFEFINA